jgi:hypothetical protein
VLGALSILAQQGLRIGLGDRQQLQVRSFGFARALFPTADCVRVHVEVERKQCLRRIQGQAYFPDFLRFELRRFGGQFGHAQIDRLCPFIGKRVLQSALQFTNTLDDFFLFAIGYFPCLIAVTRVLSGREARRLSLSDSATEWWYRQSQPGGDARPLQVGVTPTNLLLRLVHEYCARSSVQRSFATDERASVRCAVGSAARVNDFETYASGVY